MAEPTNRSNQPPPPNNQDGTGLPTPAPTPPSSVSPDPKNDTSLERFFAEIDKLKDSVAKTNELLEQQAALQKAIAEMQNSTDESSLKLKKEEINSEEKSLDDIATILDAEKKSREELVITIAQLREDIKKTQPESQEEVDAALAEALSQTGEEPKTSRKENIAALLQSSNAQQVALNSSIDTMREMKESDKAVEEDIDKQTRFAEEERMKKVGSPITPGEAATIKLLKEDNSLLKKIRDLLDSSILSKIFKVAIFGLLVLTGIIIYKYFPQILEFVKGLKDKIVDFVKNFDWKKTWEWLKTIPEKIVNALKSLKDKIVSAYEYLTTRGFKGIMIDLKDALLGFLGKWGGFIWEKIKESLIWYGKELALAAGTLLIGGAKLLLGYIWDKIWGGLSYIGGLLMDGFNWFRHTFIAINSIIGVVMSIWAWFKGTGSISQIFAAIGSGYLPNLINKLFAVMGGKGGILSTIVSSIGGLFSSAAASAGPIGQILSPIVSFATKLAPWIARAVSIFGKVLPIIGAVMLAWDAIKGAIMGFSKDGIAGAIKGVIANVLAGLSFGLLDFEKIYKWIDDGINWVAEGLLGIWDGMMSLFSTIGSWISDAISWIGSGLSSLWDGVIDMFKSVGNAFMNFAMYIFSIPAKILGFITSVAATLLKKVVDILPDWAVPDSVAKFITDLTRVPKEGSSISSAPSGSKVVAIIAPPKMTTNQKIVLEQTEDEKRFLDSMSSAKQDAGMKERLRKQMEVGSSVAANTLNTAMNSNNLAKMARTAATTVINAPTNNVVGGGSNSGPMAIAATNNRNTDPTVRALSFSESPAM